MSKMHVFQKGKLGVAMGPRSSMPLLVIVAATTAINAARCEPFETSNIDLEINRGLRDEVDVIKLDRIIDGIPERKDLRPLMRSLASSPYYVRSYLHMRTNVNPDIFSDVMVLANDSYIINLQFDGAQVSINHERSNARAKKTVQDHDVKPMGPNRAEP